MRAETRLQRNIRHYLQVCGFRSVAVPNGATLAGNAKQRAIQMANLKRDGLTVGFPDLIIFGPDRIGFIEVKMPDGSVTAAQAACHEWLTEFGQSVAVVRSLEEAKATLIEWGWI